MLTKHERELVVSIAPVMLTCQQERLLLQSPGDHGSQLCIRVSRRQGAGNRTDEGHCCMPDCC